VAYSRWWLERRGVRRWPPVRQWQHDHRGSGFREMPAMLGHHVRLEAHVWAREELRVTGWSRAQARVRVRWRRKWRAVADGFGARGKRSRGGYCPGACRGGCSVALWPTVAMAWRGGGWRRAAHRRPMEDGGSPAGMCARPGYGEPYMHSGGSAGPGTASRRGGRAAMSCAGAPGCLYSFT
jgi:hypothetical protein